MTIGVLKEGGNENRVVLLPEHVASLVKKEFSVQVEQGAGLIRGLTDRQHPVGHETCGVDHGQGRVAAGKGHQGGSGSGHHGPLSLLASILRRALFTFATSSSDTPSRSS